MMFGMTDGELGDTELPQDKEGEVAYVLDLESSMLKWSQGLYTVLGYDNQALINTVEWWTEHIHPDDAMILNQAMDKLADPWAKDWTVSYRFRKADNSYVMVDDHTIVVRDQTGNPVRLIGTIKPREVFAPPQFS
jgi:PAS domain-containing protein